MAKKFEWVYTDLTADEKQMMLDSARQLSDAMYKLTIIFEQIDGDILTDVIGGKDYPFVNSFDDAMFDVWNMESNLKANADRMKKSEMREVDSDDIL